MKIRETIQGMREFTYEIGFYLFLILLGYFICLHFSIGDIGKGVEERLTRAEDSISKLNTQGYIGKSLEKKGH